MTRQPRLSVVMIARDEAHNIVGCFDSFWAHVDEVVLCDTGSVDDTIAEAQRYADTHPGPEFKLITFPWCEDFAAAREHAHLRANGDVHIRIDLDDRIVGGEHLRGVCQAMVTHPDLNVIMVKWSGPITPAQWRAQIFRPPTSWVGRTYEYPVFTEGHAGSTELISWHHTRTTARGRRDLDIALAWAQDEPHSWRPLNAAGEEAYILSEWAHCERLCARALRISMPAHTRAYFLQLQARARLRDGRPGPAMTAARKAVAIAGEISEPGETDFTEVQHKAWMTIIECELALREQAVLDAAKHALATATSQESRDAVTALIRRHERRPAPRPHAAAAVGAPPSSNTATSTVTFSGGTR